MKPKAKTEKKQRMKISDHMLSAAQAVTAAPSVGFVASEKLLRQILKMVEAHEDWIPDADGVGDSMHIVVNDFTGGVWLCEHHGECNTHEFTRVQRLA